MAFHPDDAQRDSQRLLIGALNVRATAGWSIVLLTLALSVPRCCWSQERLPGFGEDQKLPKLLRFGKFAEVWPRVIDADMRTADGWLKEYDKDRSGLLEYKETSTWPLNSHEMYDLNRDGRMLRDELVLAIAIQRITKADANAAAQRAKEKAEKEKQKNKEQGEQEQAAQQTPLPMTLRPDATTVARQAACGALAAQMILPLDLDRNGQLERHEWFEKDRRFTKFGSGADVDSDGVITSPELTAWLVRRLPPIATSRLAPAAQPLDANGDGQISFPEFAPQPTPEQLEQFRSLDHNQDGLIVPEESHSPPIPPNHLGFAMNVPQPIVAHQPLRSELWVAEDFPIEHLVVRLGLTLPNDHELRIMLLAPNGDSVILFGGGWRPWPDAFQFERTLFDDSAAKIDETLAQIPLSKRLRPDALKSNEPGLNQFVGKSCRGKWTLLVQNASDQQGVLHHWSLWVREK